MAIQAPNFAQRVATELPLFLPGARANLQLLQDDWDRPVGGFSDICRTIQLASANTNSLIQTLTILGSFRGHVSIEVRFNPHYTYWNDLEFFLERYHLGLDGRRCLAETVEQIQSLFAIVTQNGSLPPASQNKIQAIVDQGKCPHDLMCKPKYSRIL